MKKLPTWAKVGISVVVLGVPLTAMYYAGKFIRRKIQERQGLKDATNKGSTGIIDKSVFPLMQGSKGKEVSVVQYYYNLKYGGKLRLDGIWGSKTQEMLSKVGLTEIDKKKYVEIAKYVDNIVNKGGGNASASIGK